MTRSIGIVAGLALLLAGEWAGAATLRGVVLAEDGKPAAGARVWAVNLTPFRPLDRREGVTDGEGRFALAVEPGQYRLDAALGDQGSADPLSVSTLLDGPGELIPAIIRLQTQSRLRVRLVEAETGRPVVGARLALDNGFDPTTDADGRLEVAGLGGGPHHQALVVAPGRERKWVLFELADGPTTELEVAVPRGGKAVGRVLDTAGRPVPGATISPLITREAFLLQNFLRVGVDAEGRFEYDGLPVDRGVPLLGQASGHIGQWQSNIRPEPNGRPADVEFQIPPRPRRQGQGEIALGPAGLQQQQPTRIVTGLVVDVKRRPVAATVRWTPELRTMTDSAGRFRLDRVPDVADGTVHVIPEPADLAPEIQEIGGGDQEILIVLPPGRTAAGVVRDDRRTPVAGVKVIPSVDGIGLWLADRSTVTDAKGRFAIAGLPDVPSSGQFTGAGLISVSARRLDLDGENAVVMNPLGAILGQVVDTEGRPVRNFRVLLKPPHDPMPTDPPRPQPPAYGGIGPTFTAADGVFAIPNLDRNSVHRVTVLATGHGEATIDRVVAAPRNHWVADRPVVFQLGPPRTLRVHVVAADTGRPIPDARVALAYEPIPVTDYTWSGNVNAPSESIRTRSDARGIATFDPLSLAEARVLVQVAGYGRRHVLWQDGAADLTIPLEPEAVVEGAVLAGESGRALEGTFVSLLSDLNGRLGITPRFGAGGRFRFGEVPAGTYSLEVHNATTTLHQESITLRAGEHATRVLKLAIPPPNVPNNLNGPGHAAPPR